MLRLNDSKNINCIAKPG